MDLERFVKGVEGELQQQPADERLPYLKGRLASIEDPSHRALANRLILLGMSLGQNEHEKIAVLIHGIRTHAIWQEKVASVLDAKGVSTIPVGYGYIDAFRFWFPYGFRSGPVDRVLRELRQIRAKHKSADVCVVAHSFGTYILSKILAEHPDIEMSRLLLCGSVIPSTYRWDLVPALPAEGVLNDVGARDIWPVLARATSWGYGATGTLGFKTHLVTDRFHDCGHSGFFSDEHIQKYWVPYIVDGRIVSPDSARSQPSGWMSFCSTGPTKSLLLLLLVGTLFLIYWR